MKKGKKQNKTKKRHNAALEAGFVCPLSTSLHGGLTGHETQSVIPPPRK